LDEPKPKIYVGVKWGFDNPTVMLAGQYSPAKDHLLVFREIYQEAFYFDDLLLIAKAWYQEMQVRKFFCDPKEEVYIKQMRRARLNARAVLDEPGLARGLLAKRMENWLYCQVCANPPEHGPPYDEHKICPVCGGTPRNSIRFTSMVPRTIPEFGKYRMPERDPRKAYRDKPLEIDNYGISALHFLVLGLSMEVTPTIRWL
jgi:hypothetical protein